MTQTSQQKNQQFISSNNTKTTNSDQLTEVITEALLEKKAEDIVVLDVHELTTLADKFVICHATTEVQIKAIANNVYKETAEKLQEKPWKEEGRDSRRWVILDYVNVVVHVFNKDLREYYALERMWNDAPVQEIKDER